MNNNDLATVVLDGGTLGSDPNIVTTSDMSQFADTTAVLQNSSVDSLHPDTVMAPTLVPTISSTVDTVSQTTAQSSGHGNFVPIAALLIAVVLLVILVIGTKPKKLNVEDNSGSKINTNKTNGE